MARRHLPIPIMTLLLGTAAIGVGMIGFGNGRLGRRFSALDFVYGAVLAVVALWMTIDLDYPGAYPPIAATTTPAALAAKASTSTIPIVFTIGAAQSSLSCNKLEPARR